MKHTLLNVARLATVLAFLVVVMPVAAQTKVATAGKATVATKPVTATASTSSTANVVYRIKLGAYKNPDLKKFEPLKPVKNGAIHTEMTETGLTRVLIGDFKTEAEATASLEGIKKAGYTDAFVTKRKVETTTTTKTTVETTKGGAVNQVDKTKTTTTTTTTTPVADDTKYYVQLGSFTQPDFKAFGNLADLGQLYSEYQDEKFRVSLGTFTGKEAADKALQAAKKRGHEAAFLRKVETKADGKVIVSVPVANPPVSTKK